MLKNLSFFMVAGALALTSACIVTVSDDATTGTNEDTTTGTPGDGDPGDGDPGDGDPGDGDPSGDGDGDPGDGDPGDGDPGDGDPGDGDPTGGDPLCGWAGEFYDCGGMGEDPNMTFPIACPDGLVAGEACDTVDPPLSGEGCCAGDFNYYCTQDGTIFEVDCAA